MKLRTPPLSLFAAAAVTLLAACSEPSHPDPRTEAPRVSVTRV